MRIISKMRKQKAVYWAKLTNDEYGKAQYANPVEIDCRWEDVAKEYSDREGNVQVSRSRVFVDRDMNVDDMLMLGELNSDADNDPINNEGAWKIQRFDKLPILKATEFLRTCYL